MKDKYVVEYSVLDKLWHIDKLVSSLKANLNTYFDDKKVTYIILHIADSYEEANEALELLKKAKADLKLQEELRNKIIQFPNKNNQD